MTLTITFLVIVTFKYPQLDVIVEGGLILNRKPIAIGIIILFLITTITPITQGIVNKESNHPISDGNILYVGGSEEGNYTKIQDAIENASDGDTVFVYDDSSPYYERFYINKSINLIGEDKNTTIIDGNYQGNVVVIQSDYVTVNGFKIINCVMINETKYVIHVSDSNNVVIKDNYISVGKNIIPYGIFGIGILINNSSYNLIQNNIIFKEGEQCVTIGISAIRHSNYNNFSGNEIYRYSSGIKTEDSDNNEFYANNIHQTVFGIVINGDNDSIINNNINNNEGRGIYLSRCRNTLVYRNTITNNDGNGIYISICNSCSIINNNISNNRPKGIHIYQCKSCNFINNNIINNEPRGIYIDSEGFWDRGNIISKNNLISNGKNAGFINFFLPSKTRWVNNYWGRPRILPKIIFGWIVIILPCYYGIPFPWVQFDWFPAKEPYDIGV